MAATYTHSQDIRLDTSVATIYATGKDIYNNGYLSAVLRSYFPDDPELRNKIMRSVKGLPDYFFDGEVWSPIISANTNSIMIYDSEINVSKLKIFSLNEQVSKYHKRKCYARSQSLIVIITKRL